MFFVLFYDKQQVLKCVYLGSLIRESKEQISHLILDKTSTLFVSHANEKHAEIYKINTLEEIRKRLSKKLKKEKRKLENATSTELEDNTDNNEKNIEIEQNVNDEYTRICFLKTKHKIKYVELCVDKKLNKINNNETSSCLVGVMLTNNQFEVYELNLNIKPTHAQDTSNLKLLYTIENAAHRTDVRTISFSSDSSAFLTASGDSLKIWNRLSLTCIRTLQCEYALSSAFLPDDTHVLIGTKVNIKR